MFKNIIHRTIDNSYVITKNDMPYHVPNEGRWKSLWNEINEYVKTHEEEVQVETPLVSSKEEMQLDIQNEYTNLIQSILDNEAQKLGYDNCLSVCSYMDTGVQKFDDEGTCFRKWRSAVWNKGYELLDKVTSGEMEIPSEDELIEMLPKLELIYSE